MKKYKHLSEGDRETIAYLQAIGKSMREIGFYLSRNVATISRELKRNKEPHRYRPHLAHQKAKARRLIPRKPCTLKSNLQLKKYVIEHLKVGWSPELISGRLKYHQNELPFVSHEAIYKWIYDKEKSLTKSLVRSHRTRHKKRARPWPKRLIPQRVSILERPEIINLRQVPGHWEADLVVGSGRSALQVLIERKSRFTLFTKTRDKTAQACYEALVSLFSQVDESLRKSITYDNGIENMLHVEINQKFSMKSYFCQPYHSWEKGSIENNNGLIRRHLPKKTNFDNLPNSTILGTQNWINNRPKKCLKYYTPLESLISFSVALRP